MLNFKKNSIFQRGGGHEEEPDMDTGGVLAVWGSPGSGKTTTAVKLAKYLADHKKNVSLLLSVMWSRSWEMWPFRFLIPVKWNNRDWKGTY